MRIMKKVKNSFLWLLALPSSTSPALWSYAESQGIERSRIVFAPHIEKKAHLVRMNLFADLLLDTPHYNAHTSAGDALWAGVPILTVKGETMASRVCSSMIEAAAICSPTPNSSNPSTPSTPSTSSTPSSSSSSCLSEKSNTNLISNTSDIDFSQMIVKDMKEYEEKAVLFGNQPEMVRQSKRIILQRREKNVLV
eukprot:TRINITY_DN4025_c0_g1_i2.p1 TRINITY_DN4025_c0_g1~~TRINITY_DN4025_c0_g1_i2.p1  ORF type:complete len:195 (+),score=31.88 TRINITY_DN4025_c0_g1_i2:1306-1890(+)